MLESASALGGHILSSTVDVGFDHDACYVSVPRGELGADGVDDNGLVVMVFLGVAVCIPGCQDWVGRGRGEGLTAVQWGISPEGLGLWRLC